MRQFLFTTAVLSILILTACTPAPTVTSVPSEKPPIQPSSTPTATPTLKPTIEATATQPAPPTNPRFVEGIGNIISVVQRESDKKWYGVNELGMAVTIQNDKDEWVPYDRPMKLAQNGNTDPLITLESLGLTEIKPEDVTRLKGGVLDVEWLPTMTHYTTDELKRVHDDVLPFGIVSEEKPYENSTEHPEWKGITNFYISGINRGASKTIHNSANQIAYKYLIYEVPLQFESQIILILLPDQKYNANDGVFLVPDSKNVQDANRHSMTDHDVMIALSANKSVGDQLVIALQMYDEQPQYFDACTQLVTGLKNGEGTDIIFGDKSIFRIFMPKP